MWLSWKRQDVCSYSIMRQTVREKPVGDYCKHSVNSAALLIDCSIFHLPCVLGRNTIAFFVAIGQLTNAEL